MQPTVGPGPWSGSAGPCAGWAGVPPGRPASRPARPVCSPVLPAGAPAHPVSLFQLHHNTCIYVILFGFLHVHFLICLFLGGMFAQTSSTFINEISILLVFVWVRNSWCGFPQIHISISYLGNRLLQVILIIAVRDCVTSWSYQESLSLHSA